MAECFIVKWGVHIARRRIATDIAEVQRERAELDAAYARNAAQQQDYTKAMLEFTALINYGAHDEAIEVLKAANARLREGVQS